MGQDFTQTYYLWFDTTLCGILALSAQWFRDYGLNR